MNERPEDGDELGLARPFLSAGLGPAVPGTAEPAAGEADGVRPYFLTGGRVHDGVEGFETVYGLAADGERRLPSLTFERRAIVELCRTPQSAAEISALLHLPLGVAVVLARDLAAEGCLTASSAQSDPTADPELIMRVIHAVHAL